MPPRRRRKITCLECSFVLREPKFYEKRRYQILAVVAVVLLVLAVLAFIRARSNMALAKELRAEYETWVAMLPRLPDSENGMLLILEAHDLLPNSLPERFHEADFSLNYSGDLKLLDPADVKLVKECLSDNKDTLEKIFKGLQYEKFQFPIDYSKGFYAEIYAVNELRHAAELFTLKGKLAEWDSKQLEALQEYLNVLRLGQVLDRATYLVARMEGVVVLRTGFYPLMRLLSETPVGEEDLFRVLEELKKLHAEGGEFYTMQELEHYSFLMNVADIIEGNFQYELGITERIRWSRYIYDFHYDVDIYRKAAEVWRNVDVADYHALPIEVTDHDAFMAKIGATDGLREESLVALAFISLHEQVKMLAGVETLWRGAIALTAIRLFEARNDRLPKNFSELGDLVPKDLLTDPFSGKDLIYRLKGKDFFLYSVGLNGTDDGGTDSPVYYGVVGLEEVLDIIFHQPR
jgi:hypothetical protein